MRPYTETQTFLNKTAIIRVNGQAVDVTITVLVAEDDLQIEDLYDDSVESFADVRARFERDGLFLGFIGVSAVALNAEGYDSLGGCELRCNNMFNSEPFEKSVHETLNAHGMIENALSNLKEQLESKYSELLKQADTFKPFATK